MHPPIATVLIADSSAARVLEHMRSQFVLRERPPASHRVEFLDTFDARLWRRGDHLAAYCGRGEVELRLAGADRAEVLIGSTAQVGLVRDLPPGPLRDALSVAAGERHLAPRVEVTRDELAFDVLDGRQKIVARLAIVTGVARCPPAAEGHELPTLVEVASIRGYSSERDRLVRLASEGLGGRLVARGLIEVALNACGHAQLDDPSALRVALDPAVAARIGVRRILGGLLWVVIANEAGVRGDLDAEFLHDYRVAVRRTRSILGQLRAAFTEDETTELRAELAWLANATGPVRDLDVLLAWLDLEQRDRAELVVLIDFIRAEREHERARLLAVLDSVRYGALIEGWMAFAAADDGGSVAGGLLREQVAEQVSRRFERMLAKVRKALAADDDAALHRARVDGKKLRYLFDCTPGLLPKAAVERVVGELKSIQEELGILNDTVVQRELLERLAQRLCEAAPVPHRTLLAMGALGERARRRGRRARRKFKSRWRAFVAGDVRDPLMQITGPGRAGPRA